jgi:hypothetical protein
MLNPKTNDLAVLSDFLEREHRRFESIKYAREAILKIGSLANAEAQARMALEAAEADLAWAKAKVDAVEASLPAAKEAARREIEVIRRETETAIQSMRQRQLDEDKKLDAAIAEKRAALGKMMAHIDTLRAKGMDVAVRR